MTELALALRAEIERDMGATVELLRALVTAESPTSVPESQAAAQALLRAALEDLGFEVRHAAGVISGGYLLAQAANYQPGARSQLLLGHSDTVWPLGTLAEMPFSVEEPLARGPGVFDMKGGLAQMIAALRAMRALDLKPALRPLALVNSDEEVGSPESSPAILALARQVERVFVLEPALGPEGALKTARKGVGRFELEVRGRAAHAGLEPEGGVSAVLELAHQVVALHGLNAPAEGVSVNVGVIEGGLRSNVIAPSARAIIDARAPTTARAGQLEAALVGLEPVLVGASLQVSGGFSKLPLERTPANRRLWRLAVETAAALGVELKEGAAGGGSDGNTTSQVTATLDGLGAVGAGAHASHEQMRLDNLAERAALLALLLMAPALSEENDD